MGDLTQNFSRSEFACKGALCCMNSAPVSKRLVEGLQELRNIVGPLTVTSGFRCGKHNEKIGGSENSKHCLAEAADVVSEKHPPFKIAHYAEMIGVFAEGGIGIYDNFVHLDCRTDGPARWDKRTDRDYINEED